eukprot:XP_001707655.1 Hypothetical protein GL50803_116394 [Giardia lamblia ATCC 50803]
MAGANKDCSARFSNVDPPDCMRKTVALTTETDLGRDSHKDSSFVDHESNKQMAFVRASCPSSVWARR